MVIGSLAVNIVANTQRLLKGLQSARQQINRFAKVAFTAVATAATVAGAAIVKSFRDVAPKIDQIAKAADRLTISTEALASLGHAAQLSGSSIEGLTKGMTFLVRNVGEAVQGGGEAADAFKMLGLDVHRLQLLNADQMFLEVAEAIARLPNAAQRTSAAMDIFGRSGADLLPLLMEGSTGIKAMMADAEALGITFTREQAGMVEAANDAMDRIGAAFTGLKTQLVVGLSPAISAVADQFANWVASFSSAESGANAVASAVQTLSSWLGKAADVVHTLQLGFLKVQSVIASVFAFIVRKIDEVVSFAIRSVNKLPGVNLQEGGFSRTLAEELERTSKELNDRFTRELIAKTPSERLAAATERAFSAKPNVTKPPEVSLPPEVQGAFMKIGGLFAKATELPRAAGAVAAMAAKQGIELLAQTKREPALEALVGGTREAFLASRENLRPRQATEDAQKKTAKNTQDAIPLLQGIKDGISSLASAGSQIVAGSIGG